MLTRPSRLTPIRPKLLPLSDGDCAVGLSLVACNDNSARWPRPLSCVNVGLLVGRLAFALVRSVISPARAVRLPAFSDGTLVVQPGPCAVTVVTSTYPLPVQVGHCRLLRVEDHSTTKGMRGCFTASAENEHRSHAR